MAVSRLLRERLRQLKGKVAVLSSGDELEGLHVTRADNGEVAAVERGDRVGSEPFGDSDDAGVDETEAKVGIALEEVKELSGREFPYWAEIKVSRAGGVVDAAPANWKVPLPDVATLPRTPRHASLDVLCRRSAPIGLPFLPTNARSTRGRARTRLQVVARPALAEARPRHSRLGR